MSWWKQIITGSDNETIAIGRVLGIVVFTIFVVVLPVAAVVSMIAHIIPLEEWSKLFDQMKVYIPALILSVGGLIGMTAPSEPKQKDT